MISVYCFVTKACAGCGARVAYAPRLRLRQAFERMHILCQRGRRGTASALGGLASPAHQARGSASPFDSKFCSHTNKKFALFNLSIRNLKDLVSVTTAFAKRTGAAASVERRQCKPPGRSRQSDFAWQHQSFENKHTLCYCKLCRILTLKHPC